VFISLFPPSFSLHFFSLLPSPCTPWPDGSSPPKTGLPCSSCPRTSKRSFRSNSPATSRTQTRPSNVSVVTMPFLMQVGHQLSNSWVPMAARRRAFLLWWFLSNLPKSCSICRTHPTGIPWRLTPGHAVSTQRPFRDPAPRINPSHLQSSLKSHATIQGQTAIRHRALDSDHPCT